MCVKMLDIVVLSEDVGYCHVFFLLNVFDAAAICEDVGYCRRLRRCRMLSPFVKMLDVAVVSEDVGYFRRL